MRSRLATAAAVAALVVGTGTTMPAAAAAALPASRVPAPSAAPQVAGGGAWTVYHHDNAHTGFDSTQPAATGATTGWVSPTLDETTYVEPLVYNNLVYVATANNTVYALHQTDGTVAWSTNLGVPQTGGWGCGNVNPTGILGTPVIDAAGGRIYVVAFRHLELSYYLFALDLASGAVVMHTPVGTTGFDWTIEQERGALAMSTDRSHVYVPIGGRAGDCGNYHGYVFGVPTDGSLSLETYQTPDTGNGIWAPGGVVVDDTTGKVFVTTGNGGCPSSYNYNDAVIRLSATLGVEDYFAPQDWHDNWSCNDQDLGSSSTVLISPSLAFQSGKWGTGFLVNPKNLGGIDGQLYPTPKPSTYGEVSVCFGNVHDANFGSYAYAAPYVYMSCDHNSSQGIRGGLVGLRVYPGVPSFTSCDATCAAPSWHSTDISFGPPIVAGGVVWVVDQGGSGLYGYNATTGTLVYQSAGFGAGHFTTPSEAGGQIFVASGNQARSFNMTSGCTGITVSATPQSPATVGTPVTVNASASGCPNPNPTYQFWMLPPGGAWTIVQAFSTSASYPWSTTGLAPGAYEFSVWAKDSASTGAYDVYQTLFYTLSTCSSVTASGSPPGAPDPLIPGGSKVMRGTVVTFTGTSSGGCPNPRYKFWLLGPANAGVWSMVQDYSATNTYTWNTQPGQTVGTYRLSVWLRDATSTNSYDAYDASVYYTLTAGCPGVTESSSPPSTAAGGTIVTLNGAAQGCPNPRYKFWILGPASGGVWTMVQDYSITASYQWHPTSGQTKGVYRFSVWVRDASSAATYDSYDASEYFTLT